jgi:hypothetical protein
MHSAIDKFSSIAARLQGRGTAEDVAHFVNQLVFCFFANSVKLLPERCARCGVDRGVRSDTRPAEDRA